MKRRDALKSLAAAIFSLPLLKSTSKGKELAQRRDALAESKHSDTLIVHFEMFSRGKRYTLGAKIAPDEAKKSVESFLRAVEWSAILHFNHLPLDSEGIERALGTSLPAPDVSRFKMDDYSGR